MSLLGRSGSSSDATTSEDDTGDTLRPRRQSNDEGHSSTGGTHNMKLGPWFNGKHNALTLERSSAEGQKAFPTSVYLDKLEGEGGPPEGRRQGLFSDSLLHTDALTMSADNSMLFTASDCQMFWNF